MNKKINVVEFITNLNEGGAESLVRDYALLLNEQNINVIIVVLWAPYENSPYVKALAEKGCKVISIYPRKKMCKTYVGQKIWNRLIHDSFVKYKLLQIIKDYEVEILTNPMDLIGM